MSNYVQFFRGTPQAYANAVKNNDTLYFIAETDKDEGKLYLGNKLISDTINSVSELNDIVLTNLADRHLLSYDSISEKWVNKSVTDAIGLMVGAANGKQGANGLVPAPGIGDEKLFLRGDGVWASPGDISSVNLQVDGRSVTTLDDGITLTLKDFGKKYYKYIPASENVEAHYEVQIVDTNHPWQEGLTPKVVIDSNNELVLGWFEKDTSLDHKFDALQLEVNSLKSKVKVNQGSIASIQTHVSNISDILNKKANIADVYTKSETDAKIAAAAHLERKTFQTLAEAEAFAESASKPEQYVYMVKNEKSNEYDSYDEYLYIDGKLEKVGAWEANLSDYATKVELAAVDAKVGNIAALLNGKADKSEIEAIATIVENKADKAEVKTLSDLLGQVNTRVESLESFMNSEYFVTQEQYKLDLDEIREIVTWRDL